MSDLLAYLLTWTTHGTWLPGDPRGWVHHRDGGIQGLDAARLACARKVMKQSPVRLTKRQREIVRRTIRRSCRAKGWELHALCVLSNHVHIVLRAYEQSPEKVMSSLKAWSSRKLNEVYPARSGRKWWTRHGSTRYIKSEASLNQAIEYVRHQ